MKLIFSVGTCTFGLIHTNDDGSKVYEVSRHGMTISYGEIFPADADYNDFYKWVSDHGYL